MDLGGLAGGERAVNMGEAVENHEEEQLAKEEAMKAEREAWAKAAGGEA